MSNLNNVENRSTLKKNSKNVIIISSIDWSFNWQGPQEIALRLAQEGNRVLYVENIGIRVPTLKDAGRVITRISRYFKSLFSSEIAEVERNLFIYSPIVLPPFSSIFFNLLNYLLFLPSIKRVAKRLNMSDATIWCFLPTDTAYDLINLLKEKNSTTIYYVAGDFEPLVSDVSELRKNDKKIANSSDIVLTICNKLSDRYTSYHSNVHTLPYGVDLSAFQNDVKTHKILDSTLQIMTQLHQEKRKIIGYIGGLHRFVNIEMLHQSALAKPDWIWVFVGPIQENFDKLRQLPNVIFLGSQPHDQLVHFISLYDVCIIPYTDVVYTQTVVPVKLNEYLAAGKPVVATDIPSIKEFNSQFNVVNVCKNNTNDFLSAIELSLESVETKDIIENRKNVAKLSDWKLQLKTINQLISEVKPGK